MSEQADEVTETPETEPEDVARRVHPDTGGYQYTGDDSKAEVNSTEADA